jgi:hypothetical protein
MRLAIALLLVAVATGPAAAQQKSQAPQKPAPQQQVKPPAEATPKLTEREEMLRQRLLLKERFNKGWDVQIENARDRIEARCKAEARRRFSVLHPLKRRRAAKDCIAKARH